MFRVFVEPPTDRRDIYLRIGLCFEHGLNQWQNGLVQFAVPLIMGLWAWRKQDNWFDLCKWTLSFTLLVICLIAIICAAPVPTAVAKLAGSVVFAILILLTILGSAFCITIDRFRMRLR